MFAALGSFALATSPAAAQVVHKCRDADGALSYQDSPCPAGTEQAPPRIDPPPRDAGEATDALARAAPQPGAPRDAPRPRPSTASPLPLYRCTRYDGQRSYVSQDGTPRRYQVPLWTVLPEMIGTRAGGVSMGGSRARPAPRNPVLGAYTWVEDRCYRMSRAEQCAHWRQRDDEVYRQRRTAFSDTRPALDAEQAQLRSDRDSYCR